MGSEVRLSANRPCSTELRDKKEGSRLSLQSYVQSRACQHALDSRGMEKATPAIKVIPSLGLVEAPFPQN